MKLTKYLVLAFAFSLLLGSGCSKGGTPAPAGGDDDDHIYTPTDVTAPVVIINTPTTLQTFASGATINISGRLTDDYGLYQGSIRITKDATGQVVRQQLYEIHGFLEYNYARNEVITEAGDYTVTVSFEDHGLNTTAATVKIKVVP